MGYASCWKPFATVAKKLQPHGCYSIERLRRFKTSAEDNRRWRLLLTCLLMPLPCIVLATLIEAFPLAPPESGPYENYVFWIRASAVTYFVDYSVLQQVSQSLARLKMEHRYIVTIALVGTVVSFAAVFSVALWAAFPVPFSMLVASPPSVAVILLGFWYLWGRRWTADAGLRHDLVRHMMVFVWQVALTFIYPLYIFGFTSLAGISQTLFVLLLPTIKAVGESWISYTLGDQNDIKPEVIVFNIEVFNALYVSCAVQNSTSPATTAALMLVDVLHFWFSMTGTMGVLEEVKTLMEKIPSDHPCAGESFVELAIRMLAIQDRAEISARRGSSKKRDLLFLKPAPRSKSLKGEAIVRTPTRTEVILMKRVLPKPNQVYPRIQRIKTETVNVGLSEGGCKASGESYALEHIFSRQEQAALIHTTTRVLFITEYLILVEYTEAVLPMVYGTCD
jgi:hypothetical protein